MIRSALAFKWTGQSQFSAMKIFKLCFQVSLIGLFFSIVQLFWFESRQPFLRKSVLVDLGYAALSGVIIRPLTSFAIAGFILMLGRILPNDVVHELLKDSSFLTTLPLWAQAVFIIVVTDFLGYWIHRAFHSKFLWPFHAVHHSSEELDWASNYRLHPVNDGLQTAVQIVPFILLGLPFTAILTVAPFFALVDALAHANLRFHWGPLDKVFVSPRFHRQHHRLDYPHGNYSPFLSLWDSLFGTVTPVLPPGAAPVKYGVTDVAPTMKGHFIDPLRKFARLFRGAV